MKSRLAASRPIIATRGIGFPPCDRTSPRAFDRDVVAQYLMHLDLIASSGRSMHLEGRNTRAANPGGTYKEGSDWESIEHSHKELLLAWRAPRVSANRTLGILSSERDAGRGQHRDNVTSRAGGRSATECCPS